MVNSPKALVESGMQATDEIVRLRLQVAQQAQYLKQAQALLARVNAERAFYKAHYNAAANWIIAVTGRALPLSKAQKARGNFLATQTYKPEA